MPIFFILSIVSLVKQNKCYTSPVCQQHGIIIFRHAQNQSNKSEAVQKRATIQKLVITYNQQVSPRVLNSKSPHQPKTKMGFLMIRKTQAALQNPKKRRTRRDLKKTIRYHSPGIDFMVFFVILFYFHFNYLYAGIKEKKLSHLIK